MVLYIVIVIVALVAATYFFMQQPQFGKAPSGKRLERIQKSPHYKDGKFQNLNVTPEFAEGVTFWGVMYRFIFGKTERTHPEKAFHFTKTDLKKLNPEENVYVWMGHSSYFIQIDGKKILVDPVFSGAASPIKYTTKAFKGADLYTSDDIPELDYLIITHDHWDHLDYETVTKLLPKVKKVITGLGTGEHLEYWKYNPDSIIELDWFESANLGNGFRITAEPGRHFSGRGLTRNQAIWASFILETPSKTLFIGGDSGYDTHFKKIGEQFKIDFAILENGQYNQDWRYIHTLPEEQDRVMTDLQAKTLIPVHNSKFKLALHSWDQPLKKLFENKKGNYKIQTPAIGEKFPLDNESYQTRKWWEEYQ